MCGVTFLLGVVRAAAIVWVQQVGWYGNKELAAFRANCDYVERLTMCQAARGCATINAPTMAELHTAMEAGKITLLEEREISSASQQGPKACLSLVHKSSSAFEGSQEGNNGAELKTGADIGCFCQSCCARTLVDN